MIFAGTTLGLFKSPDGGRSWLHLSTEQVNWMVFDPEDPQRALSGHGIRRNPEEHGLRANVRGHESGFANHSLTQITGSGDQLVRQQYL